MDREILAYLIAAVSLAVAAAGLVYARYNSRVKVYRRDRADEVKIHKTQMADRLRDAEDAADKTKRSKP